MAAVEPPPWHSKFPKPTRTPPRYSRQNLLQQFKVLGGDILQAGTLLIDVRRTDYEGGYLRSSLNLPAQSFYQNMASLYRLCKSDGGPSVISRVMFYCGSSNGRGPRCAGWFADFVAMKAEMEGVPEEMAEPKVFVLEGGIKGWIGGGKEYQALVEEYEEEYWMQFPEVKAAIEKSREEGGKAGENVDVPPSERMLPPGMHFQ